MTRRTTPKTGDWVGLAMCQRVPGVNRSTPRDEAIERLLDHLAECVLAEQGAPPGWTEAEYREWRKQR